MRYYIYYVIFGLTVLGACNSQTEKATEVSVISEETLKIDSLANRYLALGRFNGSILVAQGDSIIFNKSYGLADRAAQKSFSENTTFKIGTLSELFTAHLIRKMADKEMIHLDSTISHYLPEIEANYTIQDLLAHQSGLPSIQAVKESNPNESYNTLAYVQFANKNAETKDMPSDLGYNLLGVLIEKLHEQSFQEVLNQYLSELNIENTYYQNPQANLAKGYLFHNYQGQGLEYQEAPSYQEEEAFSSKGIKSTAFDLFKLSQIIGDEELNKSGYLINDGFSYTLSKNVQTNQTIIVLSNHRHPVSDEIAQSIQAIYQKEAYTLPLLREVVEIDAKLLTDYAGFYALSPEMKLEILTENDSLYVMMGPNKITLYPQSENQFFMKENDAAMRFIRNNEGEVIQAALLNGFLEGNTIDKVKE